MQQLREHYENLDSGELLEIAGKELTAEARAVLNAVLSQRGVEGERADAAQERGARLREAEAIAAGELASRWARLGAFLVDYYGFAAIFYALAIPVASLSDELASDAFIISWAGYILLRDALPKQSFGKRLFRLRVVQRESGRPCTLTKSLLRNLSLFVPPLEALLVLGERRLRIGDYVAKTRVVRASA